MNDQRTMPDLLELIKSGSIKEYCVGTGPHTLGNVTVLIGGVPVLYLDKIDPQLPLCLRIVPAEMSCTMVAKWLEVDE